MLDENQDHHLCISEFLAGMKTIFSGTYENMVKLVFKMYDFNLDNLITRNDIKAVLSHVPLNTKNLVNSFKFKYEKEEYQGRVESQEEIKIYLDKMFENKEFLDQETFDKVTQDICSEPFLFVRIC